MLDNWTFEDFKEKFFFHTKTDSDVFSQIEMIPVSGEREQLVSEFLTEARTIFEVSSLPFFVAFFAAGVSHSKLLESLLLKAKEDGCAKSHEVAMFLLEKQLYTTAVSAVVPTFENLHEAEILADQIEKLNNSIVMNAYGCLEKYSKFVLKSILLEDLYSGLNHLESSSLKIGNSSPNKLKNRIDADSRESDNELSETELYDEHILNKGYSVEQYTELFSALYDFLPSPLLLSELRKIESLRHILIHRNGVIDQKYVNEVDQNLSVGQKVTLSPTELKSFMEAFGDYFKQLFSITNKKF
ncbi:RiboL-PSP-HEPN domain-containing protein [Vibrio crassostreae]|uniref:hypothetical protein n=1 Tax=Vibrio crassostreae TaxID=246167 RepID=UPI00104E0291|nr:hypothetical protein [Vibrio crassostreae]TCW09106.1 hypothetical protein EDB49_102314 [Vibrio crassostreae]CAK3163530.1 RiboL-PSP-HEPN domain-containing protein [Vibrio crassostreae]CAK3283758.1 RiboL-PSP-HEPN domain-containing protein [Vibrio crassostreae]CAK3697954.1 RiboL-PSP-HEPN domain-containing protein [Vibrio crassostreae]